jgi:hypothetical protein
MSAAHGYIANSIRAEVTVESAETITGSTT